MTSKEALKRIRQETAPATYMKDFNKKECCDVIEKDLEVLEIIKHIVKIADYSDRTIQGGNLVILVGGEIKTFEEYQKIKEWLENENENK